MLSNLREHLRRVRHVTSCGGNNCPSINVDLLALLNRPAHVVLTNEIYSRAAVCTARASPGSFLCSWHTLAAVLGNCRGRSLGVRRRPGRGVHTAGLHIYAWL